VSKNWHFFFLFAKGSYQTFFLVYKLLFGNLLDNYYQTGYNYFDNLFGNKNGVLLWGSLKVFSEKNSKIL